MGRDAERDAAASGAAAKGSVTELGPMSVQDALRDKSSGLPVKAHGDRAALRCGARSLFSHLIVWPNAHVLRRRAVTYTILVYVERPKVSSTGNEGWSALVELGFEPSVVPSKPYKSRARLASQSILFAA